MSSARECYKVISGLEKMLVALFEQMGFTSPRETVHELLRNNQFARINALVTGFLRTSMAELVVLCRP